MEKDCTTCLYEYQCDWPPEMVCDEYIPEQKAEERKLVNDETAEQIQSL